MRAAAAGRPAAGGAWRQAANRHEVCGLAAALAAYAGLAGLYLRPIWRYLGTHIAPDLGDPLFVLYILKWVAHEAHRGFAGFWDAPFFYPAKGVLAYSDHLLGPGLAAAAFTALMPEDMPRWIVAYNLLLWSSFAATGLATCFVLRRSGLGWAAAWLGGVMYAFSPFRWSELSHLQVLLMQLIPVTLWSFDRLLASPGRRRAALFLGCYLLHLSGGCYLAYMIHFPLAVLLANRLPELWRGGRWRAALPVLGATAAIAAAAAGALFGKYATVARGSGLHWGSSVIRTWGATALSYLTPAHASLYAQLLPYSLRRPENALFPGWLAAGLAVLGARDLWRRYRTGAHAGEDPTRGDMAAEAAAAPAGGTAVATPVPPAPPRLTTGRRLALAGLLALAAVGWLAAEARTWNMKISGVSQLTGLPRWVTRNYTMPLLLVVLGVGGWLLLRRRWTGGWPLRWGAIDPWPRGLLAAGAVTAALSFPILFGPLARLLPGLAAIRVPARFDVFTSLAIVWLAAAALDRRLGGSAAPAADPGRPTTAARRTAPGRRRRAAALALVAALLLLEVCPRRFTWQEIEDEDDFPDVVQWIADQPDVQAVLEIPLADTSTSVGSLVDISYMYYATLHWKPLVNGFSAHEPLATSWLRERCCWPAPDPETMARLRRWGVTHLVIHRSELEHWQQLELARWEATGQADLVYAGGGDRVYRIRPEPAAR